MFCKIGKKNTSKKNYAIQKRNFFVIVPEYKGGVRLCFGKFQQVMTPGIRLHLPLYHQIYLTDIRDQVHTIPKMQAISADNVPFEVDASLQFKIIDCRRAILSVANVEDALSERCKMELRDRLGSMTINEILQNKSEISKSILKNLSEIKNDWGVHIETIQIKDIKFDDTMKKAMSTVAEANRQAEAKIINAKSDIETAKQYNEAAKIYAENPLTVRLREFQLWNSVSKNPGSSIYVVPSDIFNLVQEMKKK